MSNNNTFFCDRLKRLRGGRSQSEMARICGIPQQNYNRYESGSVMPKHDALHKIAKQFNVTVDQLLSSEHNEQDPSLTVEEIGVAHRQAVERASWPAKVMEAEPVPCPYCASKDKEIEWMRTQFVRSQELFAAALAAIERKV